MIKEIYDSLEPLKKPYIYRAVEAAKVTIPSLFVDDENTEEDKFPQPYQAVGAQGINNLASKLLLSLMPVSTPFFKLTLNASNEEVAKIDNIEQIQSELDAALNKLENIILKELEAKVIRPRIFEALKQLLVSGNVALQIQPDGSLRVIRLRDYVVERDGAGNIIKFVLKEKVSPSVLPSSIQIDTNEDDVEIYTLVERVSKDKYIVTQEINDRIVSGPTEVIEDGMPFIVLRFNVIPGESYGRGHVEDYLGDLYTLDRLSKSILEAAAASSKIVFLLNPKSTISLKRLTQARSGDVIEGEPGDITALQLNKFPDLQVAFSMASNIQERLTFAFLLNRAVQRQAERVTAEEIRFVSQELEDTLGGVFSMLAEELQIPLVKKYLFKLKELGVIDQNIPNEALSPTIVTGIQALGRMHDLSKIQNFIANTVNILGPEVLLRSIDPSKLILKIAAATGVNVDDILKSEEDIQQEEVNERLAQLSQQVTPEIVKQLGNNPELIQKFIEANQQ